ncbi:hypothetical protein H8959_001086 [Pygathrix nigripes]
METAVRVESGVLIVVACLLLACPAIATGKTHVLGLQRDLCGEVKSETGPEVAQPEVHTTLGRVCLQDVESMNNSRFVLNGKQQIFSLSEDCLVLNIYSPVEATAGASRLVMVWVHGGSLITGAATSYDESALAAYGDVVVVTVQYRLGVLGFFR